MDVQQMLGETYIGDFEQHVPLVEILDQSKQFAICAAAVGFDSENQPYGEMFTAANYSGEEVIKFCEHLLGQDDIYKWEFTNVMNFVAHCKPANFHELPPRWIIFCTHDWTK